MHDWFKAGRVPGTKCWKKRVFEHSSDQLQFCDWFHATSQLAEQHIWDEEESIETVKCGCGEPSCRVFRNLFRALAEEEGFPLAFTCCHVVCWDMETDGSDHVADFRLIDMIQQIRTKRTCGCGGGCTKSMIGAAQRLCARFKRSRHSTQAFYEAEARRPTNRDLETLMDMLAFPSFGPGGDSAEQGEWLELFTEAFRIRTTTGLKGCENIFFPNTDGRFAHMPLLGVWKTEHTPCMCFRKECLLRTGKQAGHEVDDNGHHRKRRRRAATKSPTSLGLMAGF